MSKTVEPIKTPINKHKEEIDSILDNIQESYNKTYGDNVARLSSADVRSNVDTWVSTRSFIIDKILVGGRTEPCSLIPFGRQIEVAGLESTGKTTLCAQIAAETQAQNGIVIATDTEERIDHGYWTSLGVDTNRILHLEAESLEQVFDKQIKMIRLIRDKVSDRKVLMIWDSVGGTSTDAIIDDEEANPMERAKKQMMENSRLISSGIRMINTEISEKNICYLYTNQLYMVPNVTFGDPYETYGGLRLKYFATVRLRLKSVGEIFETDQVSGQKRIIGHRVNVTAKKNSMAPERISMDAAIIGGKGFSNDWTIKELAEKMDLIKKGTWSKWKTPAGEDVSFQGWQGFLDKVVPHAEYKQLAKTVMESL